MPPAEDESRILDPCPNCTTLIDVTAMEPFVEIHCPICGTKMRVRKQFNHFALQNILGEGGMGTVFEALDLNLMRPVAVKILKKEYSSDESSIAQLENEARITASISHPHVVKVFSAGRDHGQFYLAMELVGKGTLDNLMSLQGQVAEMQMLDVGMQIADGLRAAAQIGLIHRDVKPGNILFSDSHTAKVVDFGLAILMEDEAKTRGEIWGTPYYVAPEKLNNEPEDFRSDIYSLGGTMFHALSGRPPFEAASASLVALKHLKSQAVSLQAFAPDVSNETAYVINRMLHKDPLERYQSYDELIEHLKYAKAQLIERTASGLKPKPRVVLESDATKNFTAWITLVLIVFMLGAGVFAWVKRETLFPDLKIKPPTIKGTTATSDNFETEYMEAFQMLTKGQAEEAAALFGKLTDTPDLTQPRLNWARQQHGLAVMLTDQKEEAIGIFAAMEKEGLYSDEAAEVRLASYFVESARLLKDKNVIPGTITVAYGTKDFEAMALLLFAIKDWSLGAFEPAGKMLEKFTADKPVEDYKWIAEYHPLAEKYLVDYRIYLSLKKLVNGANTPASKATALAAVQNAKSKLLTTGAMPTQLESWTTTLKSAVGKATAQAEEQSIANAKNLLVVETQKWAEMEKKARVAILDFTPESSLKNDFGFAFTTATLIKKKEALKLRLTFLAEFKTQLITSLPTGKYSLPIKLRNGTVVPGTPASGDMNQLAVKSAYGFTPVRWKDLSPTSVLDLGDKIITTLDASKKQWLLGVYATLCGEKSRGNQMLLDAAQADEKLRENLAAFFDEAP